MHGEGEAGAPAPELLRARGRHAPKNNKNNNKKKKNTNNNDSNNT